MQLVDAGRRIPFPREEVSPRRVRAGERSVAEREELRVTSHPRKVAFPPDHADLRFHWHDATRTRRQPFSREPVARADVEDETTVGEPAIERVDDATSRIHRLAFEGEHRPIVRAIEVDDRHRPMLRGHETSGLRTV